LLIEIIRRNLVSAASVVPNFEELIQLKVKEILTEDGEIDEDNIEHNLKVEEKIEEA
jgi:hypothetical protein